MCFKLNGKFKSKRVQLDYRKKWIENINKAYIMRMNVNVNLMEESVIQIKSGIMMNVCVCVKNIIFVKKIIFGILLHVVANVVSI